MGPRRALGRDAAGLSGNVIGTLHSCSMPTASPARLSDPVGRLTPSAPLFPPPFLPLFHQSDIKPDNLLLKFRKGVLVYVALGDWGVAGRFEEGEDKLWPG